jgi:L-threonylcarbamoyladenylate synthase
VIETQDIYLAARHIAHGDIVAYPTESVFGLGCSPYNEMAVRKLLAMKNRPATKGFILIASDISQVLDLLEPIEPRALARVMATWPGAVTWVFPCQQHVPYYLRGEHNTLAIRVTAHPVASQLCAAAKSAIISTSANHDGQIPATNARTVQLLFGDQLDVLLDGDLGLRARPTPIYNSLTGDVIRTG